MCPGGFSGGWGYPPEKARQAKRWRGDVRKGGALRLCAVYGASRTAAIGDTRLRGNRRLEWPKKPKKADSRPLTEMPFGKKEGMTKSLQCLALNRFYKIFSYLRGGPEAFRLAIYAG